MPWPTMPGRRSVAPSSMTRKLARGANMDPDTQGLMISPTVVCDIVWMLTDPGCVRVTVEGCSEKCRSEVNWSQLEPARRLNLCDLLKTWSGRRGSNPRHSAWEADVLPLNYSRSGE